MATATRIYVVRRVDGTGTPRMVEATYAAAALRHVAGDTFTVDTPTAIEAVRLLQAGVEPEQIAVDQPEPAMVVDGGTAA